jgi:polysaccharide pyruvyl transferase WcaK-like protein
LFRGVTREALHWAEAFRFLRGTDLFIAPGTGLLTDYGTGPLGRPYDLFKWCLLARLRRCRICIVSVGAGPVFHSGSKWFIRAALRLSHYRGYRDEYSKRYVQMLGFNKAASDPVYPDLAFSLPAELFVGRSQPSGGRLVVGVGLMDYHGDRGVATAEVRPYSEFIQKMSAFVLWLLEHEYAVRVLIGDGRYDLRPREDLRRAIESKGATYDVLGVTDEVPKSVGQLIAQLASTDVIVSPRFHNLLLGLMLRKPVLSLSYHEKNTSLLRAAGLGDYAQPIDTFDVSVLTRQLRALLQSKDSIAARVEERAAKWRELLDEQYRLVFHRDQPTVPSGRSRAQELS